MNFYDFKFFPEAWIEQDEKKFQNKTNLTTLVLILLLSFYLYWDGQRDPEIGDRKPVGIVTSAINRTERKLGSTVVWKSIIKDKSVYNYDTIRTESDSKTSIELIDGTKVTLNEDTIIYINTNPEKLDINLIQGSMTVDTMNRKKSEVEKINIVHGDEVIRLEKSLLNVGKKNSNSTLLLELKEGEARLSKSDKNYSLKKGRTVISKKDFIRELEIDSANTSANKETLFQSFKERQAGFENINGIQIVKSGNQFHVFGQNEKGDFKSTISDRFSTLGKEASKPYALQDPNRILKEALASLGMQVPKNLRSQNRGWELSQKSDLSKKIIITFPANQSIVDISDMEAFVFSWKNPKPSRPLRIRLFRKDDGVKLFDKLLDSEFYSVEDFTLLKRGYYKFSIYSEEGTLIAESQFQVKLKDIDSGVKFTSPDEIYVE
ncbi:MAG TPA: FecR family protein [Leptospiraceae bacterium]|nr:FecR family protein [Leptospiraceae bacterium]HMW08541.1 FecR family protein [Leptospiraceae bacterium]HMX34129.1 FecR family protein [Leptospiraceae bacterium]HMY34296.1 FecR family protein [Leptospiraceae bacterium]HMZ66385.1 FecR family protein [Leptospiraceae bacterium]